MPILRHFKYFDDALFISWSIYVAAFRLLLFLSHKSPVSERLLHELRLVQRVGVEVAVL